MKTNWGTGTDMTRYVCGLVTAISLLAAASPGWSQQQYLYAPKAVAAEEKVHNKDGVLVEEVVVRKGDTLYGISRAFSGRGSYYPQILLFNDIRNPDRIYPGDIFRIPVSRSAVPDRSVKPRLQSRVQAAPPAEAVAAITAADLKNGAAAEETNRNKKQKAAVPAAAQARQAKQPAAVTSEQRQYERAIKAYRQDDYRTALELFDRFLADHPSSALAADASLYKAECYLKQSNQ
jgi:LysM repeat protein